MLELNDVHTHYGLSHVLQGVSLRVDAGEVVGLFGRNGVGKTTVMKTIAGWVAPTQGTVQFDGQPIGGVASERICRQGIGFVPEDRRIFPGLTVEENLVLGFMQSPGRSRAGDRRQLDATYTRFPRLGERRQRMGTTRSGGEQQMLAMARVLVGTPRLLLIDEMQADNARVRILNGTSTANLDSRTGSYLAEEGIQVTELGKTKTQNRTTIVLYSPKLYAFRYLIQLLGLGRSTQILVRPDPAQTVDIEIRLGRDWTNSLPPGY